MRRSSGFIAAGALVASSLVISVRTGVARDAIPINLVGLQSKTPGFQQTGNTNISGTAIAGTFKGSGASLTNVPWGSLTGVPGTLLSLPYLGSVNSSSIGFEVDNTGSSNGIKGTAVGGIGATGDSQSGSGLKGHSSTGFGVYGQTDLTGTSCGIVGTYGSSFVAGSMAGVSGSCETNHGYGVYGWGQNGAWGVLGSSDSWIGVEGASTSWIGVYGDSTSSLGVYGGSASNDGVVGNTDGTSSTCVGVQGQWGGGTSYGVFSSGNMGADGTKSFRIDHPFDPTHKYLLHYCSEGPEPRNVYQGHVTTGPDGYAWIDLPDYYSEINRNPEYTLTVLDSSDDFVLAKVTQEVTGNRFQIRTSKPNVKVSWEVKGIRNDRWVQKYGAPVEQEKEGKAYGKYQAPELYGAPARMGQFYQPHRGGPQAGGAGQPQASRASHKMRRSG